MTCPSMPSKSCSGREEDKVKLRRWPRPTNRDETHPAGGGGRTSGRASKRLVDRSADSPAGGRAAGRLVDGQWRASKPAGGRVAGDKRRAAAGKPSGLKPRAGGGRGVGVDGGRRAVGRPGNTQASRRHGQTGTSDAEQQVLLMISAASRLCTSRSSHCLLDGPLARLPSEVPRMCMCMYMPVSLWLCLSTCRPLTCGMSTMGGVVHRKPPMMPPCPPAVAWRS